MHVGAKHARLLISSGGALIFVVFVTLLITILDTGIKKEHGARRFVWDGEAGANNLLVEQKNYNIMKENLELLSQRLNSALEKLGQLQCKAADNMTETGAWCEWPMQHKHYIDEPLAAAMSSLLQGKAVGSFGDGPGNYLDLVGPNVRVYDAYDGSPFIENATNSRVKFLDLTIPHFGLPVYDWILCLEVAEHIPREFEDIFLGNLFRHASEGIVISWAVPRQVGFGHVNPRPRRWVISRFDENCFVFDTALTNKLRRTATLFWFRNNIAVFRRKAKCSVNKELA